MCVRTITLVLAWCVSASGRRCLGPPEVARPPDRNFSTCGGAPPSVWRDAAPYPETSCAFCAGNAATAHLLEIAAELRRLKARECRRLVVYGGPAQGSTVVNFWCFGATPDSLGGDAYLERGGRAVASSGCAGRGWAVQL